jgi:hypothetical protein
MRVCFAAIRPPKLLPEISYAFSFGLLECGNTLVPAILSREIPLVGNQLSTGDANQMRLDQSIYVVRFAGL